VRGGSEIIGDNIGVKQGLSPRARGKLFSEIPWTKNHRSIPACAGEAMTEYVRALDLGVYPRVRGGSAHFAQFSRRIRVYPRVRGGSQWLPVEATTEEGLSPRARGKLQSAGILLDENRSIPACAGEAPVYAIRQTNHRVYPRVRGGSTVSVSYAKFTKGLSPRARGKHRGHPSR